MRSSHRIEGASRGRPQSQASSVPADDTPRTRGAASGTIAASVARLNRSLAETRSCELARNAGLLSSYASDSSAHA